MELSSPPCPPICHRSQAGFSVASQSVVQAFAWQLAASALLACPLGNSKGRGAAIPECVIPRADPHSLTPPFPCLVQSIVLPNMAIAIFTTVCMPFYSWLFIAHLGLGFVGAAYAVNAGYLSNLLCFLCTWLAINWRSYGTTEYAWPGWTWDMCKARATQTAHTPPSPALGSFPACRNSVSRRTTSALPAPCTVSATRAAARCFLLACLLGLRQTMDTPNVSQPRRTQRSLQSLEFAARQKGGRMGDDQRCSDPPVTRMTCSA